MSEGSNNIEQPKNNTLDAMRTGLTNFMTRREGEKPVAPIAPLNNKDTHTPLQDARDKNTQPVNPNTALKNLQNTNR